MGGNVKATTIDSNSDTIYSSGSYNNTDLTTLGTIDKYTTKQNHHHWKCRSGDGLLCSSLLSYSADTMYCQSLEDDNNDDNNEEEEAEEDGQRRKLEDNGGS